MRKIIIIAFAVIFLTGCGTSKNQKDGVPVQSKTMSPAMMSELAHGKQLFKDGYYKRAMQQLLPLAAEGSMEAQYAVGYMYYYGFGVAQDTSTGHFWIQRSADQHYEPAINALAIMEKQGKGTKF